jgi:threonine dehydratase
VAAGRPVATDTADTFIDGVACRVPDPDAIAVICAGAARILTVSEDDAAQAMRVLFAATRNVAEPAGALALAGLLSERSAMSGKRVAVIQTGGNADAGLLLQVLAGHTPTA